MSVAAWYSPSQTKKNREPDGSWEKGVSEVAGLFKELHSPVPLDVNVLPVGEGGSDGLFSCITTLFKGHEAMLVQFPIQVVMLPRKMVQV